MKLEHLNITERYLEQLPCDPSQAPFPRTVQGAAYSLVQASPCPKPQLIALNKGLALNLGFKASDFNSKELPKLLCGAQIPKSIKPWASCYGGHQFGQWAGQLGDGRAMTLFELHNQQLGYQSLQLKGAGPTPYSRQADGYAVLRSSIREYLCSEAMHHLGIPTSRALSLCLTGNEHIRDKYYDGHPKAELGAIVCRVSRSFTRFGHFELPASRGDKKLLSHLMDKCIEFDFPELIKTYKNKQERYLYWFQHITTLTCDLFVHWARVGFVHGVLNTDNMSIIGQTIDYGPYGYLDEFDPKWTPNTTDAQSRRYCFGKQAEISQWNLWKLAQALALVIEDHQSLENILQGYQTQYQQAWLHMMQQKLGFIPSDTPYKSKGEVLKENHKIYQLINKLETLLCEVETDMTLFYRQLAKLNLDQAINQHTSQQLFARCYYNSKQINSTYQQHLHTWLMSYVELSKATNLAPKQRKSSMNSVNPKYLLRNYLAQQAIEKAEHGDYSQILELQSVLQKPYDEQKSKQHYAQKRPEWAKNAPQCTMLSCSS